MIIAARSRLEVKTLRGEDAKRIPFHRSRNRLLYLPLPFSGTFSPRQTSGIENALLEFSDFDLLFFYYCDVCNLVLLINLVTLALFNVFILPIVFFVYC